TNEGGYDNDVSVLLGNGDGTFQAAVDYPLASGADSVAVGDFNGDGKLDLAVANEFSNNVSVLLGKGDGTFGPERRHSVGPDPVYVVLGDFNGDGKLDLAAVNCIDCGTVSSNPGSVSIRLGNGDGSFQGAVAYPVGPKPH